jgi:hypothetical protein
MKPTVRQTAKGLHSIDQISDSDASIKMPFSIKGSNTVEAFIYEFQRLELMNFEHRGTEPKGSSSPTHSISTPLSYDAVYKRSAQFVLFINKKNKKNSLCSAAAFWVKVQGQYWSQVKSMLHGQPNEVT